MRSFTHNFTPNIGQFGSHDLNLPFSNPWLDAKPTPPLQIAPPQPKPVNDAPILKTQDGTDFKDHYVGVNPPGYDGIEPLAQAGFAQDHPALTGIGALLLGYFLLRNYTDYSITGLFSKGKDQSTPETETAEQEVSEFQQHFDKIEVLLAKINNAKAEDRPAIYSEICQKILAQADVYEAKALDLTTIIDAIKANKPLTDAQRSELLNFIAARNKIFSAFQTDLDTLNNLMEHWNVRQMPESHTILREIEERYFRLENNPLKAIPMFGYNYLNTFSTVMIGTLVMLSVYNEGLPLLNQLPYFQEFFPGVINEVDNPHDHWESGNLWSLFRDISLFSLCIDIFYAGYNGLRSRNTNSRLAGYWNTAYDVLGTPYRAAESGLNYVVNRPMQSLFGKPWEVVSRYAYRTSSLGWLGINRQIGRDVTVRLNDFVPLRIGGVGVFGKVGDKELGLVAGSAFDYSFGLFENVMQNIIVGSKGASLGAKVAAATGDSFSLFWHNASPSATANALHSFATAKVTQHPGNDDMDIVLSRLVLGVIKGSLLTAIVASPAVGGDMATKAVFLLSANVLIGSNSIVISIAMTNDRVREGAANLIARLRN